MKEQEIPINIDLTEKPVLRKYPNESPDDEDPAKRAAFYKHKNHFFIVTIAGKPVFTRYGDVYTVSSLCASYAAILPKLHGIFNDQKRASKENTVRYIRTHGAFTVFLIRQNLIFVCVSKSKSSYFVIRKQLEQLHVQVCPCSSIAHFTDYWRAERATEQHAGTGPEGAA